MLPHSFLLTLLLIGDGANAPPPAAKAPKPATSHANTLASHVAELLIRGRTPNASDRDDLPAAIAALGRRTTTMLVETLQTGRLPADGGATGDRINVYQKEIVFAALTKLGAREAMHEFETRLAASNDDGLRTTTIEAYGELGDHSDLRRVIDLAARQTEDVDEVNGPFRTAIARLIERDVASEPSLDRIWQRIPIPFLSQLIFALGDARDGRALKLACDIVTLHSDLWPVFAAQVPCIGRSPHREVNQDAAQQLRDAVDTLSPQQQASALRALAALEDAAALPLWLERMNSDDVGLQSAALWSLQRVSKLDFGSSAERWTVWYTTEAQWNEERHDDLCTDLDSEDPTVVSDAIRELTQHRLWRHDIALEIARVLSNPHASMRALACRAIEELDSIDALPSLAQALCDDEDEVRDAAWHAMKKISGRTLDQDFEQWQSLIDDRMF